MITAEEARQLTRFDWEHHERARAIGEMIKDLCSKGVSFLHLSGEIDYEVRQILRIAGFDVKTNRVGYNPQSLEYQMETIITWL